MTWRVVGNADPRACALYDRHYSRQTVGAPRMLAPGQKILLWKDGIGRKADSIPGACWGVVRNVFREQWRWRNTVFRSEIVDPSSELIRIATIATQIAWVAEYGALPVEPLTTEIDPAATAEGRSPWHEPGWCYYKAGWKLLKIVPAGHGRSEKHVLYAPDVSGGR